MPTEAFIQAPPDSTGKLLDAYSFLVAGQTQYAQSAVLVDPYGNPLSDRRRVDLDTLAGENMQVVAPGVGLFALADELGDPLMTVRGALKVNDIHAGGLLNANGTVDGMQQAQMVAGSGLSVNWGTGAPKAVCVVDCINYSWVTVHTVALGTGGTVTFQQSNDGGTWFALNLEPLSTLGGASTSTPAAATLYSGALRARYFRINVTGITALSANGVAFFSTTPRQQQTVYSEGGATATAVSYSAGTFPISQAALAAVAGAVPASAAYLGLNARTAAPAAATTGQVVGALASVMGALISQPALLNSAVAVSASLTVVKAAAGFLSGVVVSVAGTSQALTIYDNASAASGTVIGVIPSGASAGTYYPFNMPAANGITCSGSSNNPAITVAYT